MKIISWNVNGIRSAYGKGFLKSIKKINPDIICLQEIKAQKDKIPEELINLRGYYTYFNPAEKNGYAGTAVFTKEKPIKVSCKIGFKRLDNEGRFLKLEYKNFILLNLYLPHGGRQKENLDYKLKVYQHLLKYLKKIKDKNIILAGDFNVAHSETDLARPKQNKKNTMFTSEEREQISKLIKIKFTDTFRKFNKDGGNYTWWPYMANARKRNLGWRIDYIFTSEKITKKSGNAFILNKVLGSDHCPIGLEFIKE